MARKKQSKELRVNKGKNEERFPRPSGTTTLGEELSKIPDTPPHQTERNELRKKLSQKILSHYMMNNFHYCGTQITLPELSQILQTSLQSTMRQLYKGEMALIGSVLDPQDLSDKATELLSLAFSWSLSDRVQIMQQTALLQTSQGGGYKPFISSEVSKSLKNQLESQRGILEVYKAMTNQFQQVTQLNIYNASSESTDEPLTTSRALEILDQHSLPPTSKDNAELLLEEYNEGLPEVSVKGIKSGAELDTGKKLHNIRMLQHEVDNHLARRKEDNDVSEAQIID